MNDEMKHAGVLTKDGLRNTLIDNRSKIESFGVLQLGMLDMKHSEEIKVETEIKLLVHFQPERKTIDNFLELTYFFEEITDRDVFIVTPESLSEISKQRVLDEVDYVIET